MASRSLPPPAVRALQESSSKEPDAAIGGTSANSNTVQTLDENADLATVIAKMNELIAALRR